MSDLPTPPLTASGNPAGGGLRLEAFGPSEVYSITRIDVEPPLAQQGLSDVAKVPVDVTDELVVQP